MLNGADVSQPFDPDLRPRKRTVHPHSAHRPSWAFGDTGWYGIARLTLECVRPERPRPVAASSRAQVRDHSISPRALEVAGVVTRDPGSGRPLWVIAIQIANPAGRQWLAPKRFDPASRLPGPPRKPAFIALPWAVHPRVAALDSAGMSYVPRDFSDSRCETTALWPCRHADMPTCRHADLQKCKYADMAQNPSFLIERSTTRNAKPEHRLRISSKSSRPAAPVSDFPSESSAD